MTESMRAVFMTATGGNLEEFPRIKVYYLKIIDPPPQKKIIDSLLAYIK